MYCEVCENYFAYESHYLHSINFFHVNTILIDFFVLTQKQDFPNIETLNVHDNLYFQTMFQAIIELK